MCHVPLVGGLPRATPNSLTYLLRTSRASPGRCDGRAAGTGSGDTPERPRLAATRYIISSEALPIDHEKYRIAFSFLATLLPLGFVGMIIFELCRFPNGISKS